MDKLQKLISLCKAAVYININQHKNYYETVIDHVEDSKDEIEPEVLSEMISKDTVIHIQAYSKTPVGFYLIYHYDLEKALDEAINAIEKD